MALADDIRGLRDRILADVNAAHDYYQDTRTAWDLVAASVAAGNTFTVRNTATGTETNQDQLTTRARAYLAGQLPEATFQTFLSIFEDFFFDLLRLWLVAHPESLSNRPVELKAVLKARDINAVILTVVNRELNEIKYDRPTEWFSYLDSRVKLHCPMPEEVERIAEAKATRDLLAHNRGIANAIYLAKAGRLARFREGERIEITEEYHRATWELIRKVVADVANAASARAP